MRASNASSSESVEHRKVELLQRHAQALKSSDYTTALASLQTIVALQAPAAGFTKILTPEIFQPLPPVKWLIQGIDICPGPPSLTAGYGFSAKTLSWQAAGISIATGRRAWDTFEARQGRVLHIDYEQGRRLTLDRYQRLLAAELLTPDELGDRLVVVSMPAVYLDTLGAEDVFARECEGFDLVIVDSLRAAAPTIEENSSDVRRCLDMLTRVSEKVGCTFVVIHHARKPSQEKNGGAKMAIRGSGAIFDACSSVLVFEAAKGEPVRVSHEKARTSGILADDFQLTVEDIEIDGRRRAGLRVTAEAAPSGGKEGFASIKEHIIASMRNEGPAPNKTALVDRTKGVGKRTERFSAVGQLVMDGRLVVDDGVYRLVTEEADQ